jgi:hypothetical protein
MVARALAQAPAPARHDAPRAAPEPARRAPIHTGRMTAQPRAAGPRPQDAAQLHDIGSAASPLYVAQRREALASYDDMLSRACDQPIGRTGDPVDPGALPRREERQGRPPAERPAGPRARQAGGSEEQGGEPEGPQEDRPQGEQAPDRAPREGQPQGEGGPEREQDEGAREGGAAPGGPSGAEGAGGAAAPGRRGAPAGQARRRASADGDGEPGTFAPLPVPEPATAPAQIQRRTLDLPTAQAQLAMPRYLAVQPKDGKGAVPAHLRGYEAAFLAAVAAAERRHSSFLDDARGARSELVSLYGRIEDEAQISLDTSLYDLARALTDARSGLVLAEADAISRLALQADNARKLIRTAARSALGTVAARKRVIEQRISLARAAATDVETRLAHYAGEVDRAGPLAASAFSGLQAAPAGAHVPNAAAPSTRFSPQMQAAENEPLDPAVQHHAGERSTAFTQAKDVFAGQLATAATQFQNAAIDAFRPFQHYIDSLGTAAPRQIGTMRRNALRQVDRTEAQSVDSVHRSRNQIEIGLVERYRRSREQLILTAERAAEAQHGGIERGGEGQIQAWRSIATAQSATIAALHEQIEGQAGGTPEQFANYVRQASDRTADRAEAAAAPRREQMAGAASRMREQGAVRAQAAAVSRERTARQLVDQLDVSARQSGQAMMAQILTLEAGLRQMAEPVAAVIDQFPIPAEAQLQQMETTLWEKLNTASQQADAAYNGGTPPASEERTEPAQSSPQPPARTGSSPHEYVRKSDTLAAAPQTEEQIVSVTQTIAGGVVGDVETRGGGLRDQMTLLGQNPNETLNLVRGLTYLRGQAVIKYYNQTRPGNLWDDIAFYMSFGNLVTGIGTRVHSANAVYQYLLGNRAAGALEDIQAATEWSNNADQVQEAMTHLSPADLEAMRGLPGAEAVLNAVEQDLEGADQRMFHILRTATAANAAESVAAARAVRLEAQVDEALAVAPETGADNAFDAMERTAMAGGSSRLEGAREFGLTADYQVETAEQAETRRNQSWQETVARLGHHGERWENGAEGGIAYLRQVAGRERLYAMGDTVYAASVRPEQIRLLTNLAEFGPGAPQTRAAQLRVEETRRGGATRERVEHALHDPELNSTMANPDADPNDPNTRRRPGDPPTALERARQREEQMYQLYDGYRNDDRRVSAPPRPASEIRAGLGRSLRAGHADDPRLGELMERQVTLGLNHPRTASLAFEYAVSGAGTREEVLRSQFGRMSRTEIDAAVTEYNRTHGEPGLYAELGLFDHRNDWFTELSGDDRLEIQVLAMGQPRNPRERAEVARMTSRLQLDNAGWAGQHIFAREEYRRLAASNDRLVDMMGVHEIDFDERGRLNVRGHRGTRLPVGHFSDTGEFQPTGDADAISFTALMATNQQNAQSYRQATDNAANAVTTALVVAAAVLSTAATGGAAASIWIPVLTTAAAGVIGMAASLAIKGGRYGYEDAGRDFGMTIVQAATAGLGASLTIARAGGTTALRAAAVSRMISNQGFRSLSLVEEAMIGGASGAFAGGGNALFDDHAWDSGHWLTNIGHGMEKGFLGGFASGAATGAATRGIAAGASGLGRASGFLSGLGQGSRAAAAWRYGGLRGGAWQHAFPTSLVGRTAGGALGGGVSRWVEIQYDRERGAYQGSRAQAWEEITDAGIQNGIQSYMEGVFEHAADNSPRMRAWRESILSRQTPPARAPGPRAEGGAEPPRTARHGPGEAEPAAAAPHRPDEAGPAAAPRREAEAAEGGTPRHGEPQAEVESDGSVVARTADDDGGPGRIVRAANDNPGQPVHARIDLAATDMIGMGRVPEGSVLVHPDSRSLLAANDNFVRLINADPTREAAVFHNPETGEYIVIQGDETWVASVRKGGELERVERVSLPVSRRGIPEPGGHWIMRHHYHPNREGEVGTRLLRRLPSGRGADVSVIIREAEAHGYTERSSRIYYIDNGRINYTDFSYDARSGRVSIDYPDPATGARVPMDFANLDAYHAHLAGVAGNEALAASGSGARVAARTADSGPEPEGRAPLRIDGPEPRPDMLAAHTADRGPEPALARGSAGTRLTEGDRAAVARLAEHVTDAPDADRARAAVHEMGLVGETDSMARLHLIVNDESLPVETRRRIGEAVLEANRASMIARGELGPNEPLHLIYHGAPEARSGSIRREGIDVSRVKGGSADDFGRGLYFSRDLESARLYAQRRNDSGEIFPFLMRQSDLGTVVDVRPGGEHHAAWNHYLDNTPPPPGLGPYFANMREYAGNTGTIRLNEPMRGAVFEAFLKAQGLTHAQVIHGELGADALTVGIGRGDQFSLRSQEVADRFNAQLGSRRTASGEGEGPIVARTADTGESGTMPKPPAVAGEEMATLIHPAGGDETATPIHPIGGEETAAPVHPAAGDETPVVVHPVAENEAALPAPPVKHVPETAVPQPVRPIPEHVESVLHAITEKMPSEGPYWAAMVDFVLTVDSPNAFAALMAADGPTRMEALQRFREGVLARGAKPEIAERWMRLLDHVAAKTGDAFQIQYEHAVRVAALGTQLDGLPPQMRAWLLDSPAMLVFGLQRPQRARDLYNRYIADTPDPADHTSIAFERYVLSLRKKGDEALLDQMRRLRVDFPGEDSALDALVTLGMRQGFTYRDPVGPVPLAPPQSRPISAESDLVRGLRVDHPQHGRGTVLGVQNGQVRIRFDNDPPGTEQQLPHTAGLLSRAGDPDPRFGDPPSMRSQPEINQRIARIMEFRSEALLPEYSKKSEAGTVALIELGGEVFHGTNSGLDPANYSHGIVQRRQLFDRLVAEFGLTVPNGEFKNAQFLGHAEAEAMVLAHAHFGRLPEVLEIFVDRQTCPDCSKNLIRLARMLGVRELRIYYKNQKRAPLVRQ